MKNTKCPKCNWMNEDGTLECVNCGYMFGSNSGYGGGVPDVNDYGVLSDSKMLEEISTIKVYTAPILQDIKIEEYIQVVSYEVIFGANILKDVFASVTDIIGGRSSVYENAFKEAKALVVHNLQTQCLNCGGNAIVDLKINFQTIGESRMLMCYAAGTAVKIA